MMDQEDEFEEREYDIGENAEHLGWGYLFFKYALPALGFLVLGLAVLFICYRVILAIGQIPIYR
jgi:hypothetical protein